MQTASWLHENAEYGRKLFESGLQGASSACQDFLDGQRLGPFLGESSRSALPMAGAGACIGALCALLLNEKKPRRAAFGYGLLGAVLGFGAALISKTSPLASSAARGAKKNLKAAREEHWLEKNPIDYA